MSEILEPLLLEFYEKLPIPLLAREVQLIELPGKVSAVIGMRRVGKTHRLYQKINQLLASDVDSTCIFYLNLEDDRLPSLEKGMLARLVDKFYELFPQNHQRHCWLFLDEVQNAADWPQVLRRLLDTKDVSLYVSGSSAKLLSKEIATTLRGRAIASEIWPYNLHEYAKARSKCIPKGSMSPRQRDEYLYLLNEYILNGGFAETVDYSELHRRRVHEDYVSVAILRDIMERHDVKNEHLLRYLIKFVLSNVSKPISLYKVFNDLKSQGRSVGKNTLYEYFDYISDCYLAFLVPLYTESIRKQESNPRKVYAVDTGIAASHMIGARNNMGRLFENLIYLDLRRHGYTVHYYITDSGREVDFVAIALDGTLQLVQACFDMSDKETKEREVAALREAEKEFNIRGLIVSPSNYKEFISSL